ncbi:hypothetical protein K431DRAFT_258236 [Polychaeton citri CBS 116435]|uniref:Zn(2)-C6 fungal-type domain-containing protein n=1 Tax=Polychaeton citri CBS 116435 TaxID=1314669 RepID=A0A9P4PXX5_9PEZI|nr:hypothetical protein K431DRAFT_258236 [Polychaeton citri CBS 116435]
MEIDQTIVAAQACTSCRRQKRRCDKALPSCGLCQRIGRPCDYSCEAAPLAPSPEDFAALRQQVADLQSIVQSRGSTSNRDGSQSSKSSSVSPGTNAPRFEDSPAGRLNIVTPQFAVTPGNIPQGWPGPSSFPSLFFLDSNAFEYERFTVQTPFVRVPTGALTALGSSVELRAMIETYFNTVQIYFPIVSKIRLYQHLSHPLHEPGADIALLFLAMKLAITEIPGGCPPQSQLYQDVKMLFTQVEAQNGFTIQLIQALQLIALHEVGHAIYPAAYMTIGHAARLGHAMGLHERKAPQMLTRPNTWTEQEERRRVWWGVLILEGHSNIGHRAKPMATGEPSLETLLPIDDTFWDRGQMDVAAPLSLSASTTIKAAPFTRTCQAAHLIGKVTRHLNDLTIPIDYRFQEALQLNRTICALAELLPPEAQDDDPTKPSRITALALCYSGILTLYDAYSCSERLLEYGPEDQLLMQKESIAGLDSVSEKAYQLALRIRRDFQEAGANKLSPLAIDSVYQVAANYAWMYRESSNPDYQSRLAELKDILILLNTRWKCAGQYISALVDFWERAEYDEQGRYVARR